MFSFEHYCFDFDFDFELEFVLIVFELASDVALVFRGMVGVETESKEGFLDFGRRADESAF